MISFSVDEWTLERDKLYDGLDDSVTGLTLTNFICITLESQGFTELD